MAELYGISKQSALKLLRENQVPRPRRSRIPDEQVNAAKLLFDQGLSVARAAAQVGIPASTMRKAFMQRGLPTQRRQWASERWPSLPLEIEP